MSEPKQLKGVIAALLLPRDEEGLPVWQDFDRNAEFAVRSGVAGLCVNGATGEYAGAAQEERREAVARARRAAGASGVVLSGVGATRWTRVLAYAKDAEEEGADALLVPAPHFFAYAPGDLAEFYRRIAAEVHLPVLIYNLPAFTGSLETSLALRLIREVQGIAGVKDSSGRLDLLEQVAAGRGGDGVAFVGHDGVLGEALRRGLCAGIISGVAGAIPEITLALWHSAEARDWDLFSSIEARLRELIEQLERFPAPWGLKMITALRGFGRASFSLPLSAERQVELGEFVRWFPGWWSLAETDLAQALGAEGNLRLK